MKYYYQPEYGSGYTQVQSDKYLLRYDTVEHLE